MDYTSDQALNQKERETLEYQIHFKKQMEIVDSINNVFQDLNRDLLLNKPHEINSSANKNKPPAKFEPEISNSDSPTFVGHSEQHSQEENTETARSNKSEHIKLQAEYKSLLESYNSLSQAFHSHVSLVQSPFFLDQMKVLRVDNEKLKVESHFYFEQAQKLLLENHRLKANFVHTFESAGSSAWDLDSYSHDFNLKNSSESPQKPRGLSQDADIVREIMAKQENDIQTLRYQLAEMGEFKKKHDEVASENSKLVVEIRILVEKKNLLEKDMENLSEKNSTLEKTLGKLKIHRDLLLAEKGYHQETIKELESHTQKSAEGKEHKGGTRKQEAEDLEKKYKSLEDRINGGIESDNFKQKGLLNSLDSEMTVQEILEKVAKYRTKCQNLEKDKKVTEENFEELKRTLCVLREELEGAEKKFKVLTPDSLIKLVTLLHKSKKNSQSGKLHSY